MELSDVLLILGVIVIIYVFFFKDKRDGFAAITVSSTTDATKNMGSFTLGNVVVCFGRSYFDSNPSIVITLPVSYASVAKMSPVASPNYPFNNTGDGSSAFSIVAESPNTLRVWKKDSVSGKVMQYGFYWQVVGSLT